MGYVRYRITYRKGLDMFAEPIEMNRPPVRFYHIRGYFLKRIPTKGVADALKWTTGIFVPRIVF